MKKRNKFKKEKKINFLHHTKKERFQRFKTINVFLFVAIFAVLSISCTDKGSVGGGIAGPETDIKFDTLKVASLTVDTLTAYSGNLNFLSVGHFEDPLFGNIKAVGLFKPMLASNGDTLVIDKKTQVTLNLVVPDTTYGDTLSTQKFKLYEAQELWRGNAWKITNHIDRKSTPLTTFSVGNKFATADKDTVKIPLPAQWINKYAQYFNTDKSNRDSSYVREFFGFVMVSEGKNKIITVDPYNTSFHATNVAVVDSTSNIISRYDSLRFGLREWAFSTERTNISPNPQSSSKLISTYKRVIRFDFDFTFDKIPSYKIAKVELIFYVDELRLKQSLNQLGPNVARPSAKILNLFYLEGDELPQSMSASAALARSKYNKEDQAYYFNITTPVVRGLFSRTNDNRSFYLTIGKDTGIIRSSLIFNALTKGKAPKVVVTYVETEN